MKRGFCLACRNGEDGFGVVRGVRSTTGLLAALAAASLLAESCAPAAAPEPQASGGAVPWVNRPAPAYVPPPQPRPTAAYPPCRARQLAGRAGGGGPAAGTVYQEAALTNRSGRPCTLSGGPAAVTGVRVTGGMTTLTRAAAGVSFVGPGPANLRPGHSGWVTLTYGDGCPALTSGGTALYRTLFLVVDGERVRVEFPAALNLICGLDASRFGAPPPPPPGSRSPLNVLTATIAIPATLTAGVTASYTVTLRNPSRAAVRLAPCPSYIEYLGVFTGPGRQLSLERYYYLNCAAIRRITAHGSVTFAMRIPVPAQAGRAKFDWQLQDTNIATATVVTIRSRSQ
jgi:hypothetical protein